MTAAGPELRFETAAMLLNVRRVMKTRSSSMSSSYKFYQRSSDTRGGRYGVVVRSGIYRRATRVRLVHETGLSGSAAQNSHSKLLLLFCALVPSLNHNILWPVWGRSAALVAMVTIAGLK